MEEESDQSFVLRLRGRLDRTRAGALWQSCTSELESVKPNHLIVDFEGATGIDTAGVVLLQGIEDRCRALGAGVSYRNIPRFMEQVIFYMKEHSTPVESPRPRELPGLVDRLGRWAQRKIGETVLFVRFIGDFTVSGIKAIAHPYRLDCGLTILNQLIRTGYEAVPIALLLSALMGAIMVFQGAATVRNFGNVVLIANVVAVAVTREMAPLLTAVVIAGRSGAAFAAEIGSMKINEELVALSVMDFNVTEFIVVPRVFALTLAGPILTLLADAAGIIGGLITSRVVLGLSPEAFMHEIQISLNASDIYTGVIKGLSFGALIGLTGCYCGLRTKMSAAAIGIQTTSAVVIGILLIVAADALLAGIFHLYRL